MEESAALPRPHDIENPWHSRPIDVHRWSDHPEILGMANTLWAECFPADQNPEAGPGPKPKTAFRTQLRVLLLDLFVAWLQDPTLSIGVPMSVNEWDTKSRYNAIHLSKRIVPIVHRLNAYGYLDLAKGSYSGPGLPGNRTTRIRASVCLQAVFVASGVRRDDFRQVETEECIILKANDDTTARSYLVEYEDTEKTHRMREELRAYNGILASAFIDIPELEGAVVERAVKAGPEAGSVKRQPIGHHHQFVRRIFSRGSWDANGRFYGPWWQQVGSELRSQIYINDTPTVEVDFKGLHVAILSAEQGLEVGGDPYELAGGLVTGAPPTLQREVIKRLVLTALNARDHKSAYQSFRDGWRTAMNRSPQSGPR